MCKYSAFIHPLNNGVFMAKNFIFNEGPDDKTGELCVEVTCKCGEVMSVNYYSPRNGDKQKCALSCKCGERTDATYNQDVAGVWRREVRE